MTTNWRDSGARKCLEPNHSPPNIDVSAHAARSSPDASGAPCSVAKATIDTSNEPKIAPVAMADMIVRSTPECRKAATCGTFDWCSGAGVGSVDRCLIKTKVPATPMTIAKIMGAGRANEMANHAVISGPMVKISSSKILSRAKAVRSFGDEANPSRAITNVQRARTAGPMAGEQAPAPTTITAEIARGHANSILIMNRAKPKLSPAINQPRTLCCPRRSTKRLEMIIPAAAESEKAADITPASP